MTERKNQCMSSSPHWNCW